MYNLDKKIESSWNVLSQPEKMSLARKLGADCARIRMEYGTAAAAEAHSHRALTCMHPCHCQPPPPLTHTRHLT